MSFDSMTIVYISLESLIAVLSVAGNVLVLVAVCINKRLRTITNQFIASLATADILVGVVAIPCAIVSFLGYPIGDFDACILMNTIIIVFTQISIFNLLAIASERYMAIKHPFAYERKCTTRRANIVIAFTWLLAILLSLIPLMGWNLGRPFVPELCAFTRVIDLKYMVFFNFFVCVLLPLVVVAFIYIYIFSVVIRQKRIIASLSVGLDADQGRRKRRKFLRDLNAAKSLSIIVFLFALCWIPIHILNTITVVSSASYPFPLLLAAIILSHLNSAVNPLLYAFTNSQYRRTFHKLFGGTVTNFSTDTSMVTRTQLQTISDNVS